MEDLAQFEGLGWFIVKNLLAEIDFIVVLEVGGDVVDDPLDIVGWFLQLPYPLVDAGEVVQDGEDERPIDGLAAAGPVLQS